MELELAPFDANLSAALAKLYSAFSVYPEPADLTGSPYEDVAGMFRSLKSAPLRDLTGNQIGPYAGSAILTVGGVSEYKHYLPRIVEQGVLAAPYVGTDPPIIAERLKRAGWESWPDKEQTAIKAVFYAAWSWTVGQHPGCIDASDWLCGIAALEEPIDLVLNDWATRSSIDALLQAAWLGMMVKDLLSEGEDDLAYWTYVKSEVRRSVVEWVTSQDRIKAFQAGIDAVGEDDRWYVERALSIALDQARH